MAFVGPAIGAGMQVAGGIMGMRSAKQQAKQAKQEAATSAAEQGQAAAQAAQARAPLVTEAGRLMEAKHSIDPTQMASIMTPQLAAVGGAAGEAAAKLQGAAARMHNPMGQAKAIGDIMRQKAKGAAGIGEKTAMADIMGAQKLREEGRDIFGQLQRGSTAEELEAAKERAGSTELAGQLGQQEGADLSQAGKAVASMGPPGGSGAPSPTGDEGLDLSRTSASRMKRLWE